MNYRIELGSTFKRKVKRLRKKYHSLDKELGQLAVELRQNPAAGIDLGHGVRKVRMTIYDKAEQDTISNNEIARLLQELEERQ